MQTFEQNLTILQGASFEESWTWGQGRRNTPVDLTGCTARMQVRAEVDSVTVLLNLTTENGGITLGGTAGTITLYISAADTDEIEWTEAVYDLEIVQTPIDRVKRLMSGTVTVSRSVTR